MVWRGAPSSRRRTRFGRIISDPRRLSRCRRSSVGVFCRFLRKKCRWRRVRLCSLGCRKWFPPVAHLRRLRLKHGFVPDRRPLIDQMLRCGRQGRSHLGRWTRFWVWGRVRLRQSAAIRGCCNCRKLGAPVWRIQNSFRIPSAPCGNHPAQW